MTNSCAVGLVQSAEAIGLARRACFVPSEPVCGVQNGASGLTCKEENGSVVTEKRMRDGEGLASSVGNGGDAFFIRVFQQDCPDMPSRKRVHVCENLAEGQFCKGVERDLETNSVTSRTVELNGLNGSDTRENGECGMRSTISYTLPSDGSGEVANVQARSVEETERGVEGMAVEREVDVEMAPEGLNEINEWDSRVGQSSVPRLERATPVEAENADLEVDASNSAKGGTGDRVGLATGEEKDRNSYCSTTKQEEQERESEVPPGFQSPEGVEDLRLKEFADIVLDNPKGCLGIGRDQVENVVGSSSKRSDEGGEMDQSPIENEPKLEVPRRDISQEDKRIPGVPKAQPKAQPKTQPTTPIVIIIDVDDSDDDPIEMKDCESDGSSTKGGKPIRRSVREQPRPGYRYTTSQSTTASHSPHEDSDSDDCRVVGSFNPNRGQPQFAKKSYPHVQVIDDEDEDEDEDDDEDEESDTEDNESDSSDVVVAEAPQSDICKMWEEAAMRKRMGRAMRSEGSKANGDREGTTNFDEKRAESQGLTESVSTSTYHGSPDSKDQIETSEARGGVNPPPVQQESGIILERGERPVVMSEGVDGILPNCKGDNEVDNQCNGVDSGKGQSQVHNNGHQSPRDQLENVGKDVIERQIEADVRGEEENSVDLLEAKEKLKNTDHYRSSDAAEWASRGEEIQKQAAESQRLRMIKRRATTRQEEMERKQKQRIDELRLTLMKEERNMDLKDRVRCQVQTELDHIASTCTDFATLLRRFGIFVDGGSQPTTMQVNAAYKKALLKFHPDRAAAGAKGDLRGQVEAEEKFKLISRMKGILAPGPIDYRHSIFR